MAGGNRGGGGAAGGGESSVARELCKADEDEGVGDEGDEGP